MPVDLGAYVHIQPFDNFWAGVLTGVHLDGVQFDAEREWITSLQVGAEGGYDLAHVGPHWLSAYARVAGGWGSDIGFVSLGVGLAYRH